MAHETATNVDHVDNDPKFDFGNYNKRTESSQGLTLCGSDISAALENQLIGGIKPLIEDGCVDEALTFMDEGCRNTYSLAMQSNQLSNFNPSENGDDVSISESTTTTSQDIIPDERENPKSSTIGKKESQDVYRFKMIVVLILTVVAITASTCVHVFITKAERSEFEQKFKDDSVKVLEEIRNSIDTTLIQLDILAVTFVSHAKAQNDTWPFVTIPDFGVRVAKVFPLTDAFWITILPVVTPANRLKWENYSRTHDSWVEETLAVQESWDLYYGQTNLTVDRTVVTHVFGDFGPLDANISRIMLPQWQIFPFGLTAYNFDWLSVVYPEAALAAITTSRTILSDAYMIPEPDDPAALEEAQGWIQLFTDFIPPNDEPYEPIMDILYPIINDISRVDIDDSNHSNTPVGIVVASVYWRSIIRDVLPPGSNGMIVVFNNTCTKSFTYQINGPDVIFLGTNDRHDTKYDSLHVSSKVVDLEQFSYTSSLYSGISINDEYCPYTIHLYPSDTLKNSTTTKNAIIFTVITLLLIVGLGVVFILYDFKVEHRQQAVLSSAVRSSEIVSSLFPSSVQDQLYPIYQNDKNDKNNQDSTIPIADGPIAKLYPETTVMFADIKGFTAWSASRTPTQVFHLLESLYGGFDALAKVYGVFKVETIGDTYVAVVGLPTERKNHAVVMARFAQKCLEKMVIVTQKLDGEGELGPGTSDLSLRVGLNSGPTTAGVLRGEKARFQLFGDTVNTASRMESNGEGYRIHISETTAKMIDKGGKSHWLTLREGQIVVKGKGSMQTYWCDPTKNNVNNNSSSRSSSGASEQQQPNQSSLHGPPYDVDDSSQQC